MATDRLLAAVLTSLCMSSLAVAQVPSDLENAMRERSKSVWIVDAATWDRLTAPDYTVVVPTGRMQTKAERRAVLKADTALTKAPPQYDETVRVHGSTAVQRFRTDANWVMQVWVKSERGWQAVAVQVTTAAK